MARSRVSALDTTLSLAAGVASLLATRRVVLVPMDTTYLDMGASSLATGAGAVKIMM